MKNRIQNSLISVLNFDHSYENQDFYKQSNYQWINFTQLSGVNSYCDEVALRDIRMKLRRVHPSKIHFIGSGNYHYISYLYLELIKEPFILVLFDYHTDMQPSFFEGLLSCGCWVKRALDENQYLRKVVLIGARESLLLQIPDRYKDRVVAYGENKVETEDFWEDVSTAHTKLPVYLSIDKDVLTRREVVTNWDQGSLSLQELRDICDCIVKNHELLGVDICGECSQNQQSWSQYIQYNRMNNRANSSLLRHILQ